jgi:rhodanese-related sulfurtransferase
VRAADEFRGGHIIGALNVPAAELEQHRKELDKYKERPLISSCQNGAVGARVARSLKTSGFARAYALKGGIGAWRGANLPLTRDGDSKN